VVSSEIDTDSFSKGARDSTWQAGFAHQNANSGQPVVSNGRVTDYYSVTVSKTIKGNEP